MTRNTRQGFSSFAPPYFSYGGGAGRQVIMQVVNRNDPEQSGRLQVRIFGYQSDKGNIPDSELLWARPYLGSTNPMNGGIGVSPTGMMVNSIIIGHFLDGEGQQLVYSGSLGSAGKGTDEGGKLDTTGRNHDTPIAARDETTGGRVLRFDSDAQRHDDVSIPEYARNKGKNQFGQQQSPHSDESSWSMSHYQFSR